MIELARHSVQPWECDRNDHLNMQFYVARASDALAALGLRLGLGPSELAKRNLALVETETHIRFQRELRDGAPYAVKGGVVKGDGHVLTVFLELENTATKEVSGDIHDDRGALRGARPQSGRVRRGRTVAGGRRSGIGAGACATARAQDARAAAAA